MTLSKWPWSNAGQISISDIPPDKGSNSEVGGNSAGDWQCVHVSLCVSLTKEVRERGDNPLLI